MTKKADGEWRGRECAKVRTKKEFVDTIRALLVFVTSEEC